MSQAPEQYQEQHGKGPQDALNEVSSPSNPVDRDELQSRLGATPLPLSLQKRVLDVFDELSLTAQNFFGARILQVCSLLDLNKDEYSIFPSRLQAARSLESVRLSPYLEGRVPPLVDPLSAELNWNGKNNSNELGLHIVTRELILEMQTAKLISGAGAVTDSFSNINLQAEYRKIVAGYDFFLLSKIAFEPPPTISGDHLRSALRMLPHPNYALGAEVAKSKNDLDVFEFFRSLMPDRMFSEFLRHYEVSITNERSAPNYSIQLKRKESSLQGSDTVPLRLLFDYHPLSSLAAVLTINRVDNYGNLVQAPFPQKEGSEKLGPWISDFVFERGGQKSLISAHRTVASLYGAAFCYQAEARAYQRMINEGEIDKALITVRGRIHPLIVQWFNGAKVGEKSEVPDVNLIYMLPLGGGRHYPIILHQSPDPLKQIKLNLPADLTEKEIELLQGVSDALDKGTLIRVLSNLDPKDFDAESFNELSNEWQPRFSKDTSSSDDVENLRFLHCPELLSSPDKYEIFDRAFFAGLSRQLATLGEKVHKEIEEAPGTAEIEPTIEIIRAAFTKWRQDNPDQEVNEEHFPIIEDEALRRAKNIFNFEKERLLNVEEKEAHRRRVFSGYPEDAPLGGIPLRLSELISDCVVWARHDGERRNYSGDTLVPETTFDEIEGMLIDTPHTISLRYFDPLKRGGAVNVINSTGSRTKALDQNFSQLVTKFDDDILRVTKLLTNVHLALKKLQEQTSGDKRINIGDPSFKLILSQILSEKNKGGNGKEASDGSLRIVEQAHAFLEEKIKALGVEGALHQLQTIRDELFEEDQLARKKCEELRVAAATDRKKKTSDIGLTFKQINFIKALDSRKENFTKFTTWLGFDPRRRIVDIRESRTVKLIYVLQSDEGLVLEYEHNKKKKDLNHPMKANGLNIYGAGELECSQYDTSFTSVSSFLKGVNKRVNKEDPFFAYEENNGSGHYKPPWWTNPYTVSVVSWYLTRFKKHRELAGKDPVLLLPDVGMRMTDYFSKGAHVPRRTTDI